MGTITLSVEIKEDRHLVIDLPPETPVGRADLTITPRPDEPRQIANPAREAARAKLLASGFLVTDIHAPKGALALSNEELEKLGQLAPSSRSSEELLNEDRGDY